MERTSRIACVIIAWLAVLEGTAVAQGAQPAATSDATPVAPPRGESVAPTTAGGATWTSGLGLVELSARPTENKTEDKPSASSLASPSSSVSAFSVRFMGGVDKLPGQDDLSATAGGAFRYEARHLRSLFSPWIDGGFSTTRPTKLTTLTLYDFVVRGGVDWHPARIPHVAVGPFIGYRQIHSRTGDNEVTPDSERSAILQGVDVGGQIHFRTKEALVETALQRPAFEATLYGFMQGAGLADTSNRAFIGLLASAGDTFRGFANVEGCASESTTCFPRQLRLTGGFGGMW